jgi:putative membrane protein
MAVLAQVLIGLNLLIHVYIFLLETVLFKTRGRRAFALTAEQAEMLGPVMSNQGCYNGFLAAALAVGLLHPNPVVAHAFVVYGLLCIAVAGVWGAVTAKKSILFIQTLPAMVALILYHAA